VNNVGARSLRLPGESRSIESGQFDPLRSQRRLNLKSDRLIRNQTLPGMARGGDRAIDAAGDFPWPQPAIPRGSKIVTGINPPLRSGRMRCAVPTSGPFSVP
jgi:hypothetical protein